MDQIANLSAATNDRLAVMARVSTRAQAAAGGEGSGLAALHDLSLQVARGEIVTLLDAGPPGAPSAARAVLSVLAGFTPAMAGVVLLDDRILDGLPPHKRGVGFLARKLALFAHLNVAAHARFAPGISRIEATDFLRRLNLLEMADKYPHQLSADTQLRVALARALAPAPALLLLDDPMAALPQSQRAEAKALLRALCSELSVSIVHATDDVSTAFGLSHRIAVLDGGQVAQIGAPQDVYNQPQTLAVARAMGPLNVLSGTLLDSEDDVGRIRLDSGVVVEARMHAPLADGTPCLVALRPERVAVAAFLASDLGEGAVPATLIDTVFHGDIWHLRFQLDGKPGSTTEILVTRPASIAPPRGNTMSLAWQPHHATVFAAGSVEAES